MSVTEWNGRLWVWQEPQASLHCHRYITLRFHLGWILPVPSPLCCHLGRLSVFLWVHEQTEPRRVSFVLATRFNCRRRRVGERWAGSRELNDLDRKEIMTWFCLPAINEYWPLLHHVVIIYLTYHFWKHRKSVITHGFWNSSTRRVRLMNEGCGMLQKKLLFLTTLAVIIVTWFKLELLNVLTDTNLCERAGHSRVATCHSTAGMTVAS